MIRNIINMAALILIVILAPMAASAGPAVDELGFYFEAGHRRAEPDLIVAQLGATGYVSNNVSLKGGITLFDAEHLDHLLLGMDLGARFDLGSTVSPFIGFGFFYGEASEEVEARDDYIDNDGDGSIDERGETRSKRIDSMGAVYPEVGLHIWLSENVRFTGSGKYFMTTKDEVDDYWIGAVAISVYAF